MSCFTDVFCWPVLTEYTDATSRCGSMIPRREPNSSGTIPSGMMIENDHKGVSIKMSVFDATECPKCGQTAFHRFPMAVAMPGVIKPKHGELKFEPNQSFIVRPFYCESCQYVEFKHETSHSIEI